MKKPIKIYNHTKKDYATLGIIIDDILRKYEFDNDIKVFYIEFKNQETISCSIKETKRQILLTFYY